MTLPTKIRPWLPLAAACLLLRAAIGWSADGPQTGPETEKRFPPLVVPEGFKATLFACDPLIEYPSAIALGPRDKPGSAFVAIDYMTGLGTEIVRRDEIRLIEDTDGDGYADKATVYARGFNSIQGLTFHAGTVYAMHAPLLTMLRDTDGDGQADERRDLLTGLGLPPEENDVRLHCANGAVMGHDGWLYLALGDHGCNVLRPEGDRLVHHGGGILRCRPDGRGLHLFASGLRNIYDVALDDELNVFVRDNENDGGDYKIRYCCSFCGADHGYPYLYYERPAEALPPLADLGLGSSAGGVCYLERQFPAEYRGSLLFCEWGRAVVRYHPQRAGAGFAPAHETQFAAGADNDPYGFKPTDLVVERDGSLLAADWADGQRPKRGRGRIYRIQYAGAQAVAAERHVPATGDGNRIVPTAEWIKLLDSDSYYQRVKAQEAIAAGGREAFQALLAALDQENRLAARARMHAVWILAHEGSPASRDRLFGLAHSDRDERVQVQAVRAIADLTDSGDHATAARLAALAKGKSPRVLLEVIVAIGRLRWPEAPDWLNEVLSAKPADSITPHAAQQALRRSGNWAAVLRLLDLKDSEPIRTIALRAIADQAAPEVVDGLIQRLADGDATRRREYADALTRVFKTPGPWTYWGYRPPPRPANSVAWERTTAIEQALDRILQDSDRSVRLAILRRMQREGIPARMDTLAAWLANERDAEAVGAVLEALPAEPAEQRPRVLTAVVKERQHAAASRLRAIGQLPDSAMLELAADIEDGPVMAELLRRLGGAREGDAAELLVRKLSSSQGEVRASAVEVLAAIGSNDAGPPIARLLGDAEASVRQAAAAAMGRLGVRSAADTLLQLAADSDPAVRRASFQSLRELREPRVVPLAVAALADGNTQLAALECVAEMGGPEQAQPVMDLARRDPADGMLMTAIPALARWRSDSGLSATQRARIQSAIAQLQGQSGFVVEWHVSGRLADDAVQPSLDSLFKSDAGAIAWAATLAAGAEGRVTLGDKSAGEGSWLAFADVVVPEPIQAQFLGGANGKFRVWLNGQPAFQRDEPRAFQPDSDRFDAPLVGGTNRLVVQGSAAGDKAEFALRFRRKNSTAELEKLVQAALSRKGNAERGRQVFLDAKSQCSKCHRLGDQGERIGPELTGIGGRFSRIHIVESILEPSRTVTPGFQTVAVRLADGRVMSGIRMAETATTLTLADQQGQKHVLAKEDIEMQQSQAKSIMPDGLAQQLTIDQFVDLVAFLTSQTGAQAR